MCKNLIDKIYKKDTIQLIQNYYSPLKLYYMHQFETYYDNWICSDPIGTPETMHRSVTNLLRAFDCAYLKDLSAENASSCTQVQIGQNIKAFFKKNKDALQGFDLFLKDYEGYYDHNGRYYDQIIRTYAYFVFKFDFKLENRYRLIELTAQYELVALTPCDERISAFILANIAIYSRQNLTAVLRYIYKALKAQNRKEKFYKGSARWALMAVCSKLFQPVLI